jgi:hypothetical protein
MKILLYPIYAIASWILTIIAYLFAPIIVLFVDADGNLPRLLKWFQTIDAPCWGADFWATDNPTYSRYKLIVTWLWRNPAQGYDRLAKADVTRETPVTVYGDLYIKDTPPAHGGWLLITGGGYFQLSMICPFAGMCFVTHLGWNLDPIALHYSHPTMGNLKATPLRFYLGR